MTRLRPAALAAGDVRPAMAVRRGAGRAGAPRALIGALSLARLARAGGEDQRRLDVLSAWHEAPELFTDAERAALAFTEAVTLIGAGGVPDDVWAQVTQQFAEAGVVHLLMAVATINVWNRLAVATHQQLPG